MIEEMGSQAMPGLLCHVTGRNIGGVETQVHHITARFNRKRYYPIIGSLIELGSVGSLLCGAGTLVYFLGMHKDELHLFSHLCRVWWLHSSLRDKHHHIIVNFTLHAGILARVVGCLVKVPIIVLSICNGCFKERRRELLTQHISWPDDMGEINSQITGGQIVQRGVVPQHEPRVISNGIDAEALHQSCETCRTVRAYLSFSNGTFAWLEENQLDLQKHYPSLLQTFAKVVEHKTQVHLLIAGNSHLKKWQRLTKPLRIEAYAHFLGFRQDIPDLLAAADPLVLASASEELPNAVMEVIVAGKLVIATAAGGVPKLVKKLGCSCLRKMLKLWASAILRLADDPFSREAMGKKGQKRALERFDINLIVRQYEELYLKVLEAKSR